VLSNFTVKPVLRQSLFKHVKILLAFMKPSALSPFSHVSHWTLRTDKIQFRRCCKMSLEVRGLMLYWTAPWPTGTVAEQSHELGLSETDAISCGKHVGLYGRKAGMAEYLQYLGYRLHNRRIVVRLQQGREINLLPKASRLALGPTQPLFSGYWGYFFRK